jgi:hypothetical protein
MVISSAFFSWQAAIASETWRRVSFVFMNQSLALWSVALMIVNEAGDLGFHSWLLGCREMTDCGFLAKSF